METLLTLLGIFIGAFLTLLIQMYDRKDKFRLVAIERRLIAHQEAYSHWYKLIKVVHAKYENRIPVVEEARKFWINNCLFLEKKTREEFELVIRLVDLYQDKIRSVNDTKDKNEQNNIREEYRKDWERIYELPKLIQKEVELEPIVLDLKISSEGFTK